ncbi:MULTISPECIES: hypothetical protein [Streptomyces]|uniref:hypothetical protein n=1 Tax=Streptomyces TaxID=1883 RepID=UPI002E28E0C8|nr:hypothetical protein [Streptomyces sp. NBC_00269]
MTEAWGMVIAAVVAGVLAVTGTLLGMVVGRRSVTDQAQVEHLQWLRGQRQAAYVAFLDAWDQAVERMYSLVESWDDMIGHLPEYEGDGEEAMAESVMNDLEAAHEGLRPAAERVQLLGTAGIDEVALKMTTLFQNMDQAIERQLPGVATTSDWTPYREAHREALVQRHVFLGRAREEMHAAPQPGKPPRRALRPGRRY